MSLEREVTEDANRFVRTAQQIVGGGMGLNQAGAGVAPRRGEVVTAIDGVGKELDSLENAVTELGNRLAAIISPAPPSTEDNRKAQSASCELAQRICVAAYRVQTLRERVELLLSRLEL